MYQGQSEGTMYNNIESNANAILKQYADINGYNEQETLQDYDLLPSDSGLWMIDMRNNTNIPMNTRICADFIQNIAPISERILVEAPNVVRIQDNYQVPPIKETPATIASGCSTITAGSSFNFLLNLRSNVFCLIFSEQSC